MGNEKEKIPPIKHLHFRKGDLIVKEGDYGLSIYKIIRGKVRVYHESQGKEVTLETLAPGGVIGEMNFLDRALEARFASARALENAEVEAWHPARLAKEYEEMPHIIRYIADQTLRRLIRMNQVIAKLTAKRKAEEREKRRDPTADKRHFYRKEVLMECVYRPIDASPEFRLEGRIRDISMTGMGLEVRAKNAQSVPHNSGDSFYFETVLPNGMDLKFTSRIMSVAKDRTPGKLFLGMNLEDMKEDAWKRLGFFLMPT
ncbi:MAG: cyclic nucleotide-binding domain-containing protein [Desulfatiglandaceae bacterium]